MQILASAETLVFFSSTTFTSLLSWRAPTTNYCRLNSATSDSVLLACDACRALQDILSFDSKRQALATPTPSHTESLDPAQGMGHPSCSIVDRSFSPSTKTSFKRFPKCSPSSGLNSREACRWEIRARLELIWWIVDQVRRKT